MKAGDIVATGSFVTAALRACRTLTCAALVCAAWPAAHAAPTAATEVRVALSGGIDQLDPARTANGPDMAIMSQIYDTLLALDPNSGKLLPNVASSYTAKEPTLWEFKLRNDVKFQDGQPLTAEDVKYSIDRIRNPAMNSPHASQIASISEVIVVDPQTVQIRTKAPDPLLPRRMQPIGGSGRVFIVPKHYFESHSQQEVNDKPLGSGPYKLTEWRKGTSLTLERNPAYWNTAPDVATGRFTFVPENSTRVNALLQGEVDIIQRVPIADVDRIEKSQNAKIVSSMDGLVHTLLLDSRKPPFNDIKVRQAFVESLDMNNIVTHLLGKYGRVLGTPMAPTVVQFDKSIKPYATDRKGAKGLLDGKTVDLKTYTSDGRYVNDRDIYQAINAQLGSTGFKVSPQVMEWGRLIGMMQSRSGGPFYIIGWDFGEGDASKINSFLNSSSPLSVTADPEFDKLAAQAGGQMDDAKRAEDWKAAQRLVHDRYYVAAVWQAASIYGFSKRLQWDARFGDNFDLATVKVSAK
ncbi:ABC transporter substrate-binding protein [Caballeronia insecticola]|uniref:Oligopeptide ABC transporter substrate-binding protein n=1 Tax=Caballeronia insecticola TaxID=758793 RepID=R4WPV6_9BURK|nr:ABC transporter substrate-binding protein [Caballeronia insecticola]BAN26703.1 oligopeptide ABC transporter substrate-binding protein [Caballeronia insecticola]